MTKLESMINTVLRLRPLPRKLDKNNHSLPCDVDWIIQSGIVKEKREFWLQTLSLNEGLRLPLDDAQVVSFQSGKSADLKSASTGLLTINCGWIIPPYREEAECVQLDQLTNGPLFCYR